MLLEVVSTVALVSVLSLGLYHTTVTKDQPTTTYARGASKELMQDFLTKPVKRVIEGSPVAKSLSLVQVLTIFALCAAFVAAGLQL
jgi:hypothetical protein